MDINILHLSDLHFNKNKEKDIEIILAAFKKDIEKLDERIDYIFFNGDLVNSGEKVENFNYAKEKFITPLLELTNLTENEFFIVPGNHEVNRSAINEFIDGNLSGKFIDRDSINRFIDNIDKQKQLLVRLDNYNEFLTNLHSNNGYLNSKNPLFNTYILPFKGKKIGVACLNSAWSAVGGEDDYGKMLVGERQVDNSLKDLKGADYKIVMLHHPLEWLKEYDRESIYDILITEYDLILTGHVHTQKYNEIAYDSHNTIFLKSPSLFQGRTYNGYSLIKLNLFTNELTVLFREYFEGGRRVFGKAERVVEDGKMVFCIDKSTSNDVIKSSIKAKQELKKKVLLDINNKLLSVSSDSFAPKEITEIFVPPLLTSHSENSNQANKEIMDEDDKKLDDVLGSNDHILLIGKKEIGKTTLLNYFCDYYLKKYDKFIIPIIIDFDSLPGGQNVFHKASQNFLINYDIHNFNVESNFKEGNCIFLIDNFSLKKDKNIERLNEFAKKYPKNRFVLTMNENILHSMKLNELPDLGFEYKTYYINTFRRGQIRELVNKWFTFKDVNSDLILDRVMKSMKNIGLPRTPMFISLMLWILEKQSNFIPVNEASLIENFIETLLEKLHPDEVKYETVGYKIKIDFLTHLAKNMTTNGELYIDIQDFEKQYVEYFTSKGLEVNNGLKQTFFDKGILIQIGGKVYFRFSCFLEYFIALEMQEDRSLFDFIMNEDNYLEYSNEITYYTGLNQKQKSQEVLQIIQSRLIESFKEIDNMIDLDTLADLPIEEIIFANIEDGNVGEEIENLKLSDEEKDIILDDGDKHEEESHVKKRNKPHVKEAFINNLELYSNVLKNSELIDLNVKVDALEIAIEKYCKSIGLIYKIFYELFSQELDDNEKMVDSAETKYIINMITIGIPIAIQGTVLKNIGTPKLKISIDNLLPKAKSDFEKLMLISLYGDLRIEGYIELFRNLFKSTKSKLLKEIIRAKLIYYQTFYSMNKKEEEKLVSLIADTIIEIQKIKGPNAKGHIKQQILKQELNKPKKMIE